MRPIHYDRNAPRKAVALSINQDSLMRAKDLTRNLSETVEGLLAEYVQVEQARKRAEGETLDGVVSALNALHGHHGFFVR